MWWIQLPRIENDFQQLADSGAKVIITMFDTPGGGAYGAFETATELKKLQTSVVQNGYLTMTA